jgi:hypothetical protein
LRTAHSAQSPFSRAKITSQIRCPNPRLLMPLSSDLTSVAFGSSRLFDLIKHSERAHLVCLGSVTSTTAPGPYCSTIVPITPPIEATIGTPAARAISNTPLGARKFGYPIHTASDAENGVLSHSGETHPKISRICPFALLASYRFEPIRRLLPSRRCSDRHRGLANGQQESRSLQRDSSRKGCSQVLPWDATAKLPKRSRRL